MKMMLLQLKKDVVLKSLVKKVELEVLVEYLKIYNKPEFENGQEILKDIVNKVSFPYLNVQNLEKWGIKNKDDFGFLINYLKFVKIFYLKILNIKTN